MIITGERQQSRHKIGEWFVTFAIEDRKHFIISCILLDQRVDAVFQAHFLHLPLELAYLFNSTHHLYKYLSENPHCVHQITEKSFNFTFLVQNNTLLRCIPLQKPQLGQSEKIMMRKLIPIIMKQKELKKLQIKTSVEQQKRVKELSASTAQLQIEQKRKQSILNEESALKLQLERQKKENEQLSNTLHLKQIILKDIKESKGEYIELD